MAQGKHEHEWKYNEVKRRIVIPSGRKEFNVIRFCIYCLEVEEVELKENLIAQSA